MCFSGFIKPEFVLVNVFILLLKICQKVVTTNTTHHITSDDDDKKSSLPLLLSFWRAHKDASHISRFVV